MQRENQVIMSQAFIQQVSEEPLKCGRCCQALAQQQWTHSPGPHPPGAWGRGMALKEPQGLVPRGATELGV